MPYIKPDDGRREALRKGEPALSAGELNYQIFYYVKHTVNRQLKDIKKFVDQFLGNKPNYQRYNDMTGALIRCQKECNRRGLQTLIIEKVMNSYDEEIAKYEDIKIDSNGDVE